MDRNLLEDLHAYFSAIEKPTDDEKLTLLRLTNELPYFKIASLCRYDLQNKGFDTSNVDDTSMKILAEQLGRDYVEQMYMISADILAEGLDIPKITTSIKNRHSKTIEETDKDENKWYEVFVNHGEEGGTESLDAFDTFEELVEDYDDLARQHGYENISIDIWENRKNPAPTDVCLCITDG